jgi:hypothetical protein
MGLGRVMRLKLGQETFDHRTFFVVQIGPQQSLVMADVHSVDEIVIFHGCLLNVGERLRDNGLKSTMELPSENTYIGRFSEQTIPISRRQPFWFVERRNQEPPL